MVAVSGQVTVRNRANLISRLQALEYVVANGGLRTAQSYFGSVLVVPGPIGLYRREILEQIAAQEKAFGTHLAEGAVPGPLSGETFAEDFQLSLSALSLNGRIVYEPRAIAYTRAPDRTYQLINQRYRWLRGSMQVLDIYRKRLRSKSQPSTRQKIDTILICLYAFDIYILPLLNFVVLVGMLATIAHVSFPGEVLSWLLAILLLNFASSAYCVLTQNDDPSLLINVPALEVYQNILINSAWIMAAVDQLRRSRMHW